ncbi:MAG: hypothetical protein E7597_05240 [Ruminococcaceae bacterium]|nr:hypothetical protein [Oscillospiraceae bacterium]
MKKLCVLLAFVLCISTIPLGALTASAEVLSGTYGDNITWSLDTETGVLTISGTGEMKECTSYHDSPWSSNYNIKAVNIAEGITSICNFAFSDCRYLESVSIPEGVISIGESAFYNCRLLESVSIPSSMERIDPGAFFHCFALSSVYITDIAAWCGIEFIPSDSNPVINAQNLYLNGELLTELVIPDDVTVINDCAFINCDSIVSVTIPDSVTSIGASAFKNCSNLVDLNMGDGVTILKEYAFSYCNGLESVNLSKSLNTVESFAFGVCENLTTVSLPLSTVEILAWGFWDCSNITTVYYEGQEEDWAAINIGGENDPLLEANIIFGSAGEDIDGESSETNGESSEEADAVYGDINGDGDINSLDAAQVLKHDAQLITLETEAIIAADVNGDGTVNSLDAAQILKYDAKLITEF